MRAARPAQPGPGPARHHGQLVRGRHPQQGRCLVRAGRERHKGRYDARDRIGSRHALPHHRARGDERVPDRGNHGPFGMHLEDLRLPGCHGGMARPRIRGPPMARHLAAQPRRGEDLAWVAQAGRVERAADELHGVEVGRRRTSSACTRDLSTPDAVLAGDRAAVGQADVQDRAGQLLGRLAPGRRPRRRTAPAGAGCRRRRGRRWRPGCPASADSAAIRPQHRARSAVRGMTPSCTM